MLFLNSSLQGLVSNDVSGQQDTREIQLKCIFNHTSWLAIFKKEKWIKHSSPFRSSAQKHLEDIVHLFWYSLLGKTFLIFTYCNGKTKLDPQCLMCICSQAGVFLIGAAAEGQLPCILSDSLGNGRQIAA